MPRRHICRCRRLVPTIPCDHCRRADNHHRSQLPQTKARKRITRAQRLRVYARDDYRCTYCGATSDLTIDHIEPLIVDPTRTYTDDDLATACRSCNSSRGGRLSNGGRGFFLANSPGPSLSLNIPCHRVRGRG